MIIRHCAQRPTGRRVLEKQSERDNHDTRDNSGNHVALLNHNVTEKPDVGRNADIQRAHITAPEQLAEPLKKKSDADRRHKQNNLFLIDQRTQYNTLDSQRNHNHNNQCQRQGQQHRYAFFHQTDE